MFDDLTREEAVQAGAKLLEEDKFHYVVTPNPEFILAAGKDEEFRRVLNSADLVLADGIGVVYSAKIKGTPLKGRVPGIEFAADMLSCLSQRGGRLYLLGAKPGVAEEACLGAPTQEKWMARWGKHTGARLAIGLGGALDVFAGRAERAPESWRKLGLEWAYRLKKEPQRAGRMAKLPLVLVKAAGERLKKR